MRRMFTLAVFLLASSVASFLTAQSASTQTARQALIEMFFGQAANHLEKHLPDATRKSFQKMGTAGGQNLLTEFSMFAMQAKSGTNLQTFDTGSTLLTANDPRGNEKVEITVERDDLVGDEDQVEVAFHMTRNGKEETLPFIPRFTFSMKMEADVWRLNEISVTVRVPLADPDFLKSIEDRQRAQNEQMVTWSMQTVGRAETAHQSAQGSFACSLSALANSNKNGAKGIYFDPDLAAGKKNGYIFAVSGCDGSHYKLVAEPVVPDSGQRAFCSDESGELRASADGKATSCLRGGTPVGSQNGGDVAIGMAATGAGAGTPAARPLLVAPPQPQRVRVSQGVSAGLISTKVQPIYPPDAKAARIQGAVVMKALIDKSGNIFDLQLVSGHPLLAPAAMDAVKQWKYRPYLLNGNSVEVETQVTVNFTLSAR